MESLHLVMQVALLNPLAILLIEVELAGRAGTHHEGKGGATRGP